MFPIKDINPTKTRPWITKTLVIINILIYLTSIIDPEIYTQIIYIYGARAYQILQGVKLENLITSLFLHGSPIHIIGNMLYLWIFGDNVEDIMGHGKYLIFYITSGIFATYTFSIIEPNSPYPLIGASGAISGILGTYMILYPRAKILSLVTLGYYITTVEVPSIIFIGFWFILQMIFGLIELTLIYSFNIAYWAHIGGFVFGMIIGIIIKNRSIPQTI